MQERRAHRLVKIIEHVGCDIVIRDKWAPVLGVTGKKIQN